jgi:hypothetical protein
MKPPVDRLMLGEARAEVAALRVEVERLRGTLANRPMMNAHTELCVARARLAAANALLRKVQNEEHTMVDVDAFLAAQPAAPARDEGER